MKHVSARPNARALPTAGQLPPPIRRLRVLLISYLLHCFDPPFLVLLNRFPACRVFAANPCVKKTCKKKNPLTSGEWALGKLLNYCRSDITRQMCRTRGTNNMSCSNTSASGGVRSFGKAILSSRLDACQSGWIRIFLLRLEGGP